MSFKLWLFIFKTQSLYNIHFLETSMPWQNPTTHPDSTSLAYNLFSIVLGVLSTKHKLYPEQSILQTRNREKMIMLADYCQEVFGFSAQISQDTFHSSSPVKLRVRMYGELYYLPCQRTCVPIPSARPCLDLIV